MRSVRIQKTIMEFRCDAPEELFEGWHTIQDDLNHPIHAILRRQDGLPCDGGGVPGEWCNGCHWNGGSDILEEDLDYDY